MQPTKRLNLLFIAFLFPPVGGAGLPGSQRAVKLIKYLQGYRVTVLTVKEEDYLSPVELNFLRELPVKDESVVRTPFRNPFQYLLKTRAFLRRMLRRGGAAAAAPQHPAPPAPKPSPGGKLSLLQRFLDYVHALCHYPDPAGAWLYHALFLGRRLVKRGKIDVVFATGNPWTSLVLAWLLHRLTGVPYIVDFRDPWVGNPFHVSRGRLLDSLDRYLERQVVTHALLVLANTAELRKEMVERYRGTLEPEQVLVVPNGFDRDDYPVAAAPAVGCGSGPEPLVLAHAGLLYGVRDPAPLLDAITLLEQSGEVPQGAFRFVQIGRIHLDYDFCERHRELISSGVVQDLGSLPFQECLVELMKADVLLLIQPGTKSQVPSKLYDYLCLDRPILTMTPPDGALGNLIRDNGFGDLFDPRDVEGLAGCLKRLWQEKKSSDRVGVLYKNRDLFNVENIVAVLEQRMNEALSRHHREVR